MQDNDEIEIDVSEIFHVLLNKIWVILLAGIIAALAVIAGTLLFITPQYESTTKMYVLSKQDSNTLTSQDMQTSLSLTKDYAELIKSRTVTEGVITQLNLDMTHEQLLKKMSVDSATDTRILSISVRDEDPYEACEIANAIRDVAANHIKNVMDIDAVNVVETKPECCQKWRDRRRFRSCCCNCDRTDNIYFKRYDQDTGRRGTLSEAEYTGNNPPVRRRA